MKVSAMISVAYCTPCIDGHADETDGPYKGGSRMSQRGPRSIAGRNSNSRGSRGPDCTLTKDNTDCTLLNVR